MQIINHSLDILKEKAAQGVDVRVIYDDIGGMCTLPGDYYKTLSGYGIKAVCFSRLKGQADNEFNNRSHRKIMVIDGKVAYTGGVNIADEYINEKVLFGLWKDVGIRLEGEAVAQLTSIFLADYELNVKTTVSDFRPYFENGISVENNGYVIPFGDGPGPMYKHRVAKIMIMNMLNQAQNYVYMMSPYLIIDNELCQAIENAAMRGVDVRIITPHIPDKKIVFVMTRSNLDYRSLVHHFENGVWMYKHEVLSQIKDDMERTMGQSIEMTDKLIKNTLSQRFIGALVRVFSPML